MHEVSGLAKAREEAPSSQGRLIFGFLRRELRSERNASLFTTLVALALQTKRLAAGSVELLLITGRVGVSEEKVRQPVEKPREAQF